MSAVPGTPAGPGWKARIVVVSDGVADGSRADRGGPALRAALEAVGAVVEAVVVSPDGVEAVAETLLAQGTGLAALAARRQCWRAAPRSPRLASATPARCSAIPGVPPAWSQ